MVDWRKSNRDRNDTRVFLSESLFDRQVPVSPVLVSVTTRSCYDGEEAGETKDAIFANKTKMH